MSPISCTTFERKEQVSLPVVIMDGSMGRYLTTEGLPQDDLFKQIWSARALVDPAWHHVVVDAHKAYIKAGATLLTTNAYGVQPTYYAQAFPEDWEVRMLADAELAASLAVRACKASGQAGCSVRVVGCLPPLRESHRPDLFRQMLATAGQDFVLRTFTQLAQAALRGGAHALMLENMTCWEEAELGLKAIEHLGVPIMLSMEGALRCDDLKPQTQNAADIARRVLAVKLAGVPIEVLGFSCTTPEHILQCFDAIWDAGLTELLHSAGIRLSAHANCNDREAAHSKGFNVKSDKSESIVARGDLCNDQFGGYSTFCTLYVQRGCSFIGGCCGCGPEGIARLTSDLGGRSHFHPTKRSRKNSFPLTSTQGPIQTLPPTLSSTEAANQTNLASNNAIPNLIPSQPNAAVQAGTLTASQKVCGTSSLKIAVLGCGAMGSVYAALLSKAGNEVWVVDVWEDHIKAIRENGLHVDGPAGHHVAKVHATTDAAAVGREVDLAVIATKASGVGPAAEAAAAMVVGGSPGVILTIQNGLGAGDRITQFIDRSRVMLGVASNFGAAMKGPGYAEHKSMNLVAIGEMDAGSTPRLERIVETWSKAGFNAKAVPDINKVIWEKLICNCTFSGTCAILGCTVGEVLDNEHAFASALACAKEAYAVARAKGLRLDFDDVETYVRKFGDTVRKAKPSVLQDIEAGRRSEIEFINGAIQAEALKVGLTAPTNQVVTNLVRSRER